MELDEQPDGRVLLLEAAMYWASNLGPPAAVVEAAVQAVVDGVESSTLYRLAGATLDSARHEVPDLWPDVANELDLPNPDPASNEAMLLASRYLARQLISVDTPPRDIARRFHKEFHRGGHELVEALLELDDEYDLPGGAHDPEVEAAIRRLLAAPVVP